MQPPAIRVTRYNVSCLPPDHMEASHFSLAVEYRGRGLWAVLDGPFDLNAALAIATKAAPLMTVNGCTVDKILADIAGGTA